MSRPRIEDMKLDLSFISSGTAPAPAVRLWFRPTWLKSDSSIPFTMTPDEARNLAADLIATAERAER